jgi:hypothetical protein
MMGRLELLMVAIATTLLASVTTAFAPTPLLLSSSGGTSTRATGSSTMPLSVLVGTGSFLIAGCLLPSFSLVLALLDTLSVGRSVDLSFGSPPSYLTHVVQYTRWPIPVLR